MTGTLFDLNCPSEEYAKNEGNEMLPRFRFEFMLLI